MSQLAAMSKRFWRGYQRYHEAAPCKYYWRWETGHFWMIVAPLGFVLGAGQEREGKHGV